MDDLITALTTALGPLLSSLLALVFNPTVLITALLIGTAGEVIKPLVNAKRGDKGWRGVFFVTLPAQPVVIGMLLGLLPFLPPIDALVKEGYEAAGRFATYSLAGLVCKLCYDSFVSTTKRAWELVGARIMQMIRMRLPASSEKEEK